VEEGVDQRGLAVIDVRDNRDVAAVGIGNRSRLSRLGHPASIAGGVRTACFSDTIRLPAPTAEASMVVRARLFAAALVPLVYFQSLTLDDVLSRGGSFVAALQRECAVVAADETSVQVYRLYGSTHRDLMATGAPLGEVSERKVRKARSALVLVADSSASTWSAYRDVIEVDGKPLQDTPKRLELLFSEPGGGATDDIAAIVKDAIRQNLGTMNRTVSAPTLALLPLLPAHQKRFTFKKKGDKNVEGTTVWVVTFAETAGPMLARTADGTPQPIRGELWIDPTTGGVRKTHVVFDALDAYPDMKQHPERYREFPRSTIDVTYQLQPSVNAWLPSEVTELHDRQSEVTNVTATYANYRRLPVKW
jgi:hypothetical protein